MTKKLSERSCKTLENDVALWNILKLLDGLHVSNNHNDFGITSHERLHLMEVIKAPKKRTEQILTEEVPKPTEEP